jgi:hypothetical protein
MIHCKFAVTLTIQAPFLCSATGPASWGIDATFHKNENDEYCIPRTHVKGKLREAWEQLSQAGAVDIDIADLLGRETEKGDDFKPQRGRIFISDFTLEGKTEKPRKTHRIRINPVSGTVDEGAIFIAELPFKNRQSTAWQGEISFSAGDRHEANKIRERIEIGLKWITALGAQKGVGFGRLVSVQVKEKSLTTHDPALITVRPAVKSLRLSFTAKDAFTLGGKRIKDNYMTTETIVTGGVIKGAIARCIRGRTGLPENAPIAETEALSRAGLPLIGKYFEKIRFTHGFPSVKNARPVTPPFSLARDTADEYYDAALENGASGRKTEEDHYAPGIFRTDWKSNKINELLSEYGWAVPLVTAVTHTAIESVSQIARKEKLYTFEYLCPKNDEGKPVTWCGNVILPDNLSDDEAGRLRGELEYVADHWFKHIGKRDGRIETASLDAGEWPLAVGANDLVKDGLTIVTLQSDAMMLNPSDITDGGPENLEKLYGGYWRDVSGGAFSLLRFFACHDLKGGYVGRRFQTGGAYYPFLMTTAGSVFVLKANPEDEAGKICGQWLRDGLPPPAWSIEKYGKTESGRLDWERCPYTPENGFGEIAINLNCHWNQRRKS